MVDPTDKNYSPEDALTETAANLILDKMANDVLTVLALRWEDSDRYKDMGDDIAEMPSLEKHDNIFSGQIKLDSGTLVNFRLDVGPDPAVVEFAIAEGD